MANTGYILPQSASSTSETGWEDSGGAWIDPVNIYGAGEASITNNAFDNGDASHVLRGYNFDFSGIPAGSTIDGVICRVMARATNPTTAIGLAQLLNISGARVGTNLAATPITITGTTTAAEHLIGANNNNWGNSLTLAWLQDADFGVGVGVINGANNADVFIDSVELDVYYTAAAAPINITTSTGSLTLTGIAPTVSVSDNKNIQTSTGELTLTGYAPTVTVTAHVNILTSTGELVITGYAPTVLVTNNINILTSTGELILTGYSPTISITGQTKYLVTKTGYYITYNNMLIIVDSELTGDIRVLQEGADGKYTELDTTTTTTPPTFE